MQTTQSNPSKVPGVTLLISLSVWYRVAGSVSTNSITTRKAESFYWVTILLFWTAFVLTRPLGAVVGDLLDKPITSGGIAISRYAVSAVLLAFMVACLLIFRQKPASAQH